MLKLIILSESCKSSFVTFADKGSAAEHDQEDIYVGGRDTGDARGLPYRGRTD